MRGHDFPMLPTFSVGGFFPLRPISVPSFFDLPNLQLMPSGRLALFCILKERRDAAEGSVLLPAYHCPSMVEPIKWAGMSPIFYRINRDLSPDIDDIRKKWQSDTTAILVAHLFGRPCGLTGVREFCDARNIALIEDCAHTPFGTVGGSIVGTIGDYAIASPRKFYPAMDGGCVVQRTGELSVKLQSLGIMYNAKALWNTVEYAIEYSRLPLLRSVTEKRAGNGLGVNQDESVEGYVDPQFDPTNVSGKISLVSALIIKGMSRSALIKKRQRNYRFLYEELAKSAALTPFFEDADTCNVPYVLPMLLEDPDRLHTQLIRAGIPVWRWDLLYPSDCEVSKEYGKTLIQLPCHQSLTIDMLRTFVARMREVVG